MLESFLILFVLVSAVLLIVSRHRFQFENQLLTRWGIGRDWWVPVLGLTTVLLVSSFGLDIVWRVFVDKIDIIVLIFSFGILSEGLADSGFFTHISYKVTQRCSSAAELVVYVFILTSAITFVTSNDIVILLLTPILIEICFQVGLKNTKLLLLSQFIAANTLSIGLLIGSPTNIIIAEQEGIDFFRYMELLSIPAVVAFCSSLVVVYLTLYLSKNTELRFFSELEMESEYRQLSENPEPEFTSQMFHWVSIFGFFLVLVAVVTFLQVSLLYCAVPSIGVSVLYWVFSGHHEDSVRRPLKALPYGIFFFGMSFFTLAAMFSETTVFVETVTPTVQSMWGSNLASSVIGVFGTGIVVNIFNDLPASALIAQLLANLSISGSSRVLFIQSTIVGLNLGTYLTQIGALAGLLWFSQIREHRKRHSKVYTDIAGEMEFPDRMDLVKYGLLHFVVTGVVSAVFLVMYARIV